MSRCLRYRQPLRNLVIFFRPFGFIDHKYDKLDINVSYQWCGFQIPTWIPPKRKQNIKNLQTNGEPRTR